MYHTKEVVAYNVITSFVHYEQKCIKSRFLGGNSVALPELIWYNFHKCWNLNGEILYFCVKKFLRETSKNAENGKRGR